VKLQISKASGALRWLADVHYVEVSTKPPVTKSPYKLNVHISQNYCHAWLPINNKSNKQIMVWLDSLTRPQLCIWCTTPLTKETAWFVSTILDNRLTNLVIKDIG
jgi:hypothetical protein